MPSVDSEGCGPVTVCTPSPRWLTPARSFGFPRGSSPVPDAILDGRLFQLRLRLVRPKADPARGCSPRLRPPRPRPAASAPAASQALSGRAGGGTSFIFPEHSSVNNTSCGVFLEAKLMKTVSRMNRIPRFPVRTGSGLWPCPQPRAPARPATAPSSFRMFLFCPPRMRALILIFRNSALQCLS